MDKLKDLEYMVMLNIPQDKFQWIEAIDPEKAILKGRLYLVAKRVFDLVFGLLLMVVLSPLFLIIYAVIRLESPGAPVIFRQKRTGKGGNRFDMYKFRTMVPDAEQLKQELMHLNELQWPDFKITNDPRITRIGRFLRKTSLDELPQLLNVILGDMSFVGPRPTSFAAETYNLWHTTRLDVTPGITGLWQIAGRAETEFDDRLRLDITYINHRCFWLDFQIMLRTITAIWQQKGAH